MSSFAVNLVSGRWLCTSASQLMSDNTLGLEEAKLAENCHIYLVCERPAVNFDPTDFKFENGSISGSLVYKKDGQEHKEPFENPFPLKDGAVRVALSPYPHREIETFDASGKSIRYLPANFVSFGQHRYSLDHVFRQLKVLYVGQSFAGGKRSAFVRLRSHSTLQKILAEAAYQRPDSEIMVLAVEYLPYRILTIFDGRNVDVESGQADEDRFFQVHNKKIKQSQQISLIEAALIKYFQPEYNKTYKKKFPSREMKILAECYELDFSSLVVELNTDAINFLAYSDAAAPNTHHTVNVKLDNVDERKSFFRFIDSTNEFVERPTPQRSR